MVVEKKQTKEKKDWKKSVECAISKKEKRKKKKEKWLNKFNQGGVKK